MLVRTKLAPELAMDPDEPHWDFHPLLNCRSNQSSFQIDSQRSSDYAYTSGPGPGRRSGKHSLRSIASSLLCRSHDAPKDDDEDRRTIDLARTHRCHSISNYSVETLILWPVTPDDEETQPGHDSIVEFRRHSPPTIQLEETYDTDTRTWSCDHNDPFPFRNIAILDESLQEEISVLTDDFMIHDIVPHRQGEDHMFHWKMYESEELQRCSDALLFPMMMHDTTTPPRTPRRIPKSIGLFDEHGCLGSSINMALHPLMRAPTPPRNRKQQHNSAATVATPPPSSEGRVYPSRATVRSLETESANSFEFDGNVALFNDGTLAHLAYTRAPELLYVRRADNTRHPGWTARHEGYSSRRVDFTDPIVTAVHRRPYTKPDEKALFYFDPEELLTLSLDRENRIPDEEFECIAMPNCDGRNVLIRFPT